MNYPYKDMQVIRFALHRSIDIAYEIQNPKGESRHKQCSMFWDIHYLKKKELQYYVRLI